MYYVSTWTLGAFACLMLVQDVETPCKKGVLASGYIGILQVEDKRGKRGPYPKPEGHKDDSPGYKGQ